VGSTPTIPRLNKQRRIDEMEQGIEEEEETSGVAVEKDDPHFQTRLRLNLHSVLNTIRVEGIYVPYNVIPTRITQRLSGKRYPREDDIDYIRDFLEIIQTGGLVTIREDRWMLTTWGFKQFYGYIQANETERRRKAMADVETARRRYLLEFAEGRLKGKEWKKKQSLEEQNAVH
jgi:hypothetical protein